MAVDSLTQMAPVDSFLGNRMVAESKEVADESAAGAEDTDDQNLDDDGLDQSGSGEGQEDLDASGGDSDDELGEGDDESGDSETAGLSANERKLAKKLAASEAREKKFQAEKDTFIAQQSKEMDALRADIEASTTEREQNHETEDLENLLAELGDDEDYPSNKQLKKVLQTIAKRQAPAQAGGNGKLDKRTVEAIRKGLNAELSTVPQIEEVVKFAGENLASDAVYSVLESSGARAAYASRKMMGVREEAAFQRGLKQAKKRAKKPGSLKPPQEGTRGATATQGEKPKRTDSFADRFLNMSERLGVPAKLG